MFNTTANTNLGTRGYDVTTLQSDNHNFYLNNQNNQVDFQKNEKFDIFYHDLQPINVVSHFNNDIYNVNQNIVYDKNHNLLPYKQGTMQQNVGSSDVIYHDLQPVKSVVLDNFHDENYCVGQQPSFDINQQANVVNHWKNESYNKKQQYDKSFSASNNTPGFDNSQFNGHQFSGHQDYFVQNTYDPIQVPCQQNNYDLGLCSANIQQQSHYG